MSLRSALGRSRAYLRARDLLLARGRGNVDVEREDLARRYLRGSGLEIGAFFNPTRVPPGVHVRYVDRVPRDELLRIEGAWLASVGIGSDRVGPVDIVADAERLEGIPDASADFIIANHVLEHLEDPIRGLHSMLRVVRPGGVVLLILPDARFSQDATRPRTDVEHLVRDHEEGPERSRQAHYEEWAVKLEGAQGARVAERVAEYERENARHHFHVWELEGFVRLLLEVDFPADILRAELLSDEFAVVLRRR